MRDNGFARLLNNQSKTIGAAAIILGAASLVSRLLGLVRDRILAGMFGAGSELDIYYAAFRIPDLVYSLLVLGAISAGFIPVFISYFQKEKNQAWHLANSILNLLTLALIAVVVILIIFAPYLIKLVAPGFSPEQMSLAGQLTRIMFLSPLFLGLSAVFGGILQSCRRFLIYSLGPIMYNLGIIFGALFFVKYFGLFGLAGGVVIGAFLHMAIQVPTAYLCGFRWRPVFDCKFAGVKRVFKLMPPRILSLILSQANFWVMTAFASFLTIGSIAVYNFAYNIWSFPLGIFGVSFALAVFPRLSETAQNKDKDGFVRAFSKTARQILFFTLPAAALFIILRAQIVRVILGTGLFDWEDTILTLQTLAYFSLALFAEALILLFLRGFFAWEDAKTPFLIGITSSIVRLAGAWYFAQSLGVPGLALGFSLGGMLNFILLYIALRAKIGSLDDKVFFTAGIKMLAASFLAAMAAYWTLYFVEPMLNTATFVGILTQGLSAGILGILVYLFFAWVLRIRESGVFIKSLLRK